MWMKNMKFLLSFIMAVSILMVQVGGASAARAAQSTATIGGTVQSITLETDPSTGITVVLVEVVVSDLSAQTVRISEKTASDFGLVLLDGDGKPVINEEILGNYVEIDQESVIPDEEEAQHPVGNALATFFSDITDYSTIMEVYENGAGFGVITQALWMTTKLEGDSEVFQTILLAKETGEYDGITFEDGTIVKNWGQLRKAILDGKKTSNPGSVMSNQDNNGNANANGNDGNNQNKDKDKDKNKDKEKTDNNGNGGDKEKEKDK
jgi:hypothetical protein